MQTVAVVGIGRLGIGLALALEKSGLKVIGVDKNQSLVDLVNDKALKSVDTFKEILEDKGALFVESGNENQLASSILKLATDKELRNRLKHEMKVIANSRSCVNVAAKHFEIYENILK